MAAVVALAAQCRTQLVSTAVCALVYSCLRSSLNLGLTELAELLLTSPGAGVAILGLCVSSWAAHTAYYSTGSSSSSPKATWWDKTNVLTGGQTVQKLASKHELQHMGQTEASCQFSAASSSSRPVRLAQPLADLSVPLGSSSTRQLYSSSCKPRRRRLPRLSIELTPLPRLSIDFSGYRQTYNSSSSSYARASSIRRSLDRCSMMPDEAASMFRSSSWELLEEQEQVSSSSLVGCASLQLQQQLPTLAVGETTESLGLGVLPSGLGFIEDVINETHLLQVGAIMGETSARGALAAREAGGPVGHPSSFYGSADTLGYGEPWELLVSEGNDNVLYWGWRKPLRKGLHMYMTRSVFLGASPAELRAFMNDDAYRVVWDQSMTVLRPVVQADAPSTAPSAGGSSSAGSNAAVELMAAAAAARMSGHGDAETPASSSSGSSGIQPAVLPHESAVMQALVQFPKPMTSRSYLYARRVWPRPSDGGCYCLSKGCTLPLSTPLPALPGRSVTVDDYCSGCVIRAPSPQLLPPGADAAGPAAEVFMVYFEDSHVRASLANLGIKKGLWPLVQRTEKALRVYQAGAAANSHLQAPSAFSAGTNPTAEPTAEDCSSSSSEEEVMRAPRPVSASITRAASLDCELGSRPVGVGAAVLSRSQSLQHTSERTRRLSSASLPCFPLGAGLDDEEGADEPCNNCGCSCSGPAGTIHDTPQPACCSADTSCCSSNASSVCSKPQPQQQSKQARGAWGWLGSVGSRVAGVIKQSGQLLAAASGVLWRSGPSVAFMLPRFEWRVLTWAYQHLAGSRQLLLGAAAAASSADVSSRARLVQPSSHPLSEWAPGTHSGVVTQLTSQVVRRLPSHPLTAEDLLAAGEEPRRTIVTVRSEGALQLRMAYAAAAAGSASAPGSCAGSAGGSDVASFSLSCSSCGCCCGGSTNGGASSSTSHHRCHHRACSGCGCGSSSSSGMSGSCVRDETGGKRHRRVVVKLMQTAGLRVARRMGRMTGILE